MSPLCAVRPHLDLQAHLMCSKTQVVIGWGAVWPSVCPPIVTNGSHDQLVVIILHKLCPLMKTSGTQDQLVVIILHKHMQTSALPLEGLHPSYTMFWVAGGICTFKV